MNRSTLLKHVFAVILLLSLLIALPAGVAAQDGSALTLREQGNPTSDDLLKWQEVFTYEVRYSFFTLGKVRVTLTDTLYRGRTAWHISGVITSNPGIPFVGKEENHYNSIFEIVDGQPRELVYWKDDVDEEEFDQDRFVYDYQADSVYAYREGEVIKSLELREPATSGPLIFFMSRMDAGENLERQIYIYLDEEMGTIDMNYTRSQESREYRAFEPPVQAFLAEGEANIDGPFGFRGDFKAWFANDSLRIPLEAHVKVWLGNVKVRLIDYQKELRNG